MKKINNVILELESCITFNKRNDIYVIYEINAIHPGELESHIDLKRSDLLFKKAVCFFQNKKEEIITGNKGMLFIPSVNRILKIEFVKIHEDDLFVNILDQ